MQIKTKKGYHYITTRRAKMKNADKMLTSILNKWAPMLLVGMQMVQALSKRDWNFLNKLNLTQQSYFQVWVGCHALLQEIFPTQGSNSGLPGCRHILYQLSHKGSPRILEWVAYPFTSSSSWPRNRTGFSCIAGRFFTSRAIMLHFSTLIIWFEVTLSLNVQIL